MALRRELEPFGIHVTIIEPGYFRTDSLDGSSVHYGDIDIENYAEGARQRREFLDYRNHQQLGDPAKLGVALVKLAGEDRPPLRYTAGSDALERLLEKIGSMRAEADAWRELTPSTNDAA